MKTQPDRSITQPESFSPSDHVLLLPREGGDYKLIPVIAASTKEFEDAMEDELHERGGISAVDGKAEGVVNAPIKGSLKAPYRHILLGSRTPAND